MFNESQEDVYLIPSPYLLPAIGGYIAPHTIPNGIAIAAAIGALTNPDDLETNPYWQRGVGLILLNARRFVSAEFIRRYFDKRFTGWVMPRTWKPAIKERIRLEAILWGETWKMIEQLYSRSIFRPDSHPAMTFCKIVDECAWLQPYVIFDSEALGNPTATEIVRGIQSQNRLLGNLGIECIRDIPLDRTTSPATWQLIEQSRRLTCINDDFKEQYMKVIRARMALASHIKGERPKIQCDHSRPKRRNHAKMTGKL